MNEISLSIRPSQKDYGKFGLMWHFAENRVREIYTGSRRNCNEIENKIRRSFKNVRLEKSGVKDIRYWVHGYEYGSSLVYNYDFDTEKQALDAASDWLTR